MNAINIPAPAGKRIRALMVTALLISVVAGALFMPVSADSGQHPDCMYSPDGGSSDCPGLILKPVIPPWHPWWWPFPWYPWFPEPDWDLGLN